MSDENNDLSANEELLKLLNEVGSDDPIMPETPKKAVAPEPVVEVPPPPPPNTDITTVEATAVPVEDNSRYVREVLQDFGSLSKTIIGRFEEDRREIQEVLDFLKDKVYNGSNGENGVGEEYVNALANTIRTKSDASSNAVRLLDSYSKLLSASKTALSGGGGGGATKDMLELAKLLTSEAYPDERNGS